MSQKNTIYFLGGGNMAEAIINALTKSGTGMPIVVAEKSVDRREYLQQNIPSITVLEKIAQPLGFEDILFIAVKPQDVFKAVQGLELDSPLVVSIIAGLSIRILTQYLGGLNRIIRMMPNIPVSVLKGVYGLYACHQAIEPQDQEWLENALKGSGQFIWVETEDELHHITAVSGSGPAYVFYFMNALYQSAKKLGFGDVQAKTLVEQTFLGGVILAQESSFSFQELQEKVTSTRGTTQEAIKVFDAQRLDLIITEGIKAGVKRSKELSNELEAN